MKEKKLHSESGLTLIEILVVLTLIAVVSAIAITQFTNSKTNVQRQAIAREFKVFLERARFDSVKRRATGNEMARVILNSSSSFTAITDLNQDGTILNSNGTFQSADTRTVDFTQRSSTQIIVSNTLSYPVTILFNQRGQITAKDSANNDVTPVFTICSSGCSNTTQADPNSTVISVSTTGTVAMLQSGQSLSTLPTPVTTSTVPQFNCYVLMGNANTSQCINN